jgi:DNA topoisomerase-1
MAKNLVLVESPGKVKKISQILGPDYNVQASVGHIAKIADEGKYDLGIDVDGDFGLCLVVDPNKKDVVKNLKAAVKSADTVFLASDADREGEMISYCLKKFLDIPDAKAKRITFTEITEPAIKASVKKPGKIDQDMVESAMTRMSLDKIIGYRLSGVVHRKVYCKSAGRVQSAGLKILCDRENEINAFIPQKYFELYLPFEKDGIAYEAKYRGTDAAKASTFKDEAEIRKVISECAPGRYSVGRIDSSDRFVKSKLPFTTSSFQQDCSSKLNYSPKRAMEIAQKLYEQGRITYMRTDAVRFSDEFVSAAENKIKSEMGSQYYAGLRIPKDANKEAQNAHESIRPTHVEDTPESLKISMEPDLWNVYRLVYARSLAALMSDETVSDTETSIYNGPHRFSFISHAVKFDGFARAYDYSDSDDPEGKFPTLSVGESVKDGPLRLDAKETNPPARYTEAGLVSALEKSGVGRPSTYASIITVLKDPERGYTESVGKTLKPTAKGMLLSKFLDDHFSDVISLKYTSEMESTLDDIAKGKRQRVPVLKEFYSKFAPEISGMKDVQVEGLPKPELVGRKCPLCGHDLVYRQGRFGRFIACSNYTKGHCKYTERIDANGNPVPPVPADQRKPAEKTGFKCPKCGGDVVKRHSAKNNSDFYGCSHFPKCRKTWSQEEFEKEFGSGASGKIKKISVDKD